jgi:phosphoribosylformimino-5-aminoimidazole carboxamide ribotide isomerase
MIVIPAIDLKEGRCVRLVQGRMDAESVYSDDPVKMAEHWVSLGAERLHVVDLNGAVEGRPVHRDLIAEIIRAVPVPVEVGGGIRELSAAEDYLALGAAWVILGTKALGTPSFVESACRRFPGKVIVGIDARGGSVAVQGWKEELSIDAIELAGRFEGAGLSAIVFTDIEKDGTGMGVNVERTRALALATAVPVIASGGVSKLEDIEKLLGLEPDGVMGVITGRAVYTGQLDLVAAIRLGKGGKA